MQKRYLKLTKDQRARGIIFSSQLMPPLDGDPTIHEVAGSLPLPEKERKIGLLLDDKFFNNSPFKYNLIRS